MEIKSNGFAAMGLITIGSLGFGVYNAIKYHKISDQLESVQTAMTNGIEIDIPKAVVDKAIDSKVQYEVEKAIRTTKAEIMDSAKKELNNEAQNAVRGELNRMRDDVKAAVDDKIGKISIEGIKAEVIEKAKKEVADRFDDDLDDVLDEYKDNLRSMTKIFEKIADRVPKL